MFLNLVTGNQTCKFSIIARKAYRSLTIVYNRLRFYCIVIKSSGMARHIALGLNKVRDNFILLVIFTFINWREEFRRRCLS